MKSCILTVIKNEHEYLDEWIKYHLDLGINHIFIFEDIDSDSHKEICDKYDDVSLNSIDIVLNEEDKEKAIFLKKTIKWNIQHLYFRNALKWIKYKNVYDWCFVIDNDEFITIEKPLEEIFDLYKDYEAFIIQWKCFGANGYIQKPNYEGKGLIGTYTKEISGKLPDKNESLVKTCYNLKLYDGCFFYNQHHPNDKCNWCNTDYIKDLYKPTYSNIFIRHYVTKSWEEYVWKIKTRGFTWYGTRHLDTFFEINSDMLPIKQQLFDDLKKETLIVMPYKQSGSQGNEIRLALNGWRKFCQFKYYFIVIGEFDESLKNEFPWVHFIKCKSIEKKEGQYNQHLDVQHCMEIVMKRYSQIYNGFIWMVDDNYAIKPFNLDDITTVHYHNTTFVGNEKCPKSFWKYDKWKTRQLLDREGLPHYNYTTHYPCYFEFNKLKEIWNRYNMMNESYVLEDVYFNYFKHKEPILDNEIRLGIWNNDIFKNEFQKAVDNPNIKFMCNSVEGWSKELEDNLMKIVS